MPVLADAVIARILVEAWRACHSEHGWLVGRFVVMPDHVHFFVSPAGDAAKSLSSFVRYWKRGTGIAIRESGCGSFAWQRELFDHLLRSDESYAQKWEYVRLNPVRARLVSDASAWPYQGEVQALEW